MFDFQVKFHSHELMLLKIFTHLNWMNERGIGFKRFEYQLQVQNVVLKWENYHLSSECKIE